MRAKRTTNNDTLISWKVTKHDFDLIDKIVDRAMLIALHAGIEYNRGTALMDIAAVHANGCPLRLEALLTATDFDFTHDVFGIRRHLNRETGQLENCFTPRYRGVTP